MADAKQLVTMKIPVPVLDKFDALCDQREVTRTKAVIELMCQAADYVQAPRKPALRAGRAKAVKK